MVIKKYTVHVDGPEVCCRRIFKIGESKTCVPIRNHVYNMNVWRKVAWPSLTKFVTCGVTRTMVQLCTLQKPTVTRKISLNTDIIDNVY